MITLPLLVGCVAQQKQHGELGQLNVDVDCEQQRVKVNLDLDKQSQKNRVDVK